MNSVSFGTRIWKGHLKSYRYKLLLHTILTIANPTSALLRAGPSLVPSPVTATTSLFLLSRDWIIPSTNMCLSVGDERANTLRCGQMRSNLSGLIYTGNTRASVMSVWR